MLGEGGAVTGHASSTPALMKNGGGAGEESLDPNSKAATGFRTLKRVYSHQGHFHSDESRKGQKTGGALSRAARGSLALSLTNLRAMGRTVADVAESVTVIRGAFLPHPSVMILHVSTRIVLDFFWRSKRGCFRYLLCSHKVIFKTKTILGSKRYGNESGKA